MNTEKEERKIRFHSNGKLLLSGEYVVLHGADSLVLPLKYGQDLSVCELKGGFQGILKWVARENNEVWFTALFDLISLQVIDSSNSLIADTLGRILKTVKKFKPNIFTSYESLEISTNLEFNRNWGFGSSSTLLSNIARWAKTDPYKLNEAIAGGSGYDIAAAEISQPFIYNIYNKGRSTQVNFNPPFKRYLYFVYLGEKQDTFNDVKRYKDCANKPSKKLIKEVSDISNRLVNNKDLDEFEFLIEKHEKVIGDHIGKTPVKKLKFRDLEGTAKSLGSWGGDFIIMTFRKERIHLKDYLKAKGLSTYFTYDELILNTKTIKLFNEL
ncbi:MAG: hypothetical protein JW894_08030 [Bacteroidales bacterium]|nr:hypothetical protein [Bacteroidales bacterium]